MLKRDSRCVRHWLNQTRYGVFRASLLSTVSTNRVAASAVSEPQTLSVGDGGRTVATSLRSAESSRVSSPHLQTLQMSMRARREAPRLHDTGESRLSIPYSLSTRPVCPPVRGLRPVRLHDWPATTSSARKCNAEDLPTLCCR